MEVNDVHGYKACATAAVREAKNGKELIREVYAQTGIEVEIASGKREATIIYSNHVEEQVNGTKTYLYIDVGGGSTEVSLFHKKKIVETHSFPVGTVRMLNKRVREAEWNEMKKKVKKIGDTYKGITGIGTGGNINKLVKLYGHEKELFLTRKALKDGYEKLLQYSYVDRVIKFGLKPDRADVIIPAAEIFIAIMKWTDMDKIIVPKIGLSDGLIHELYEEMYTKKITEVFEE
jgi:exopolyphosphatase/guanosine-5'-triphosphate,3'-diphosphate pyrophosphatase